MPHARPPTTNMMPPPIIAPATPRPTRSSNTSTSKGTVNHTVCDRMPMLNAASSEPVTISRPDAAVIAGVNRRSPSGPGACRRHASIKHACADNAKARPGRSLIGRAAKYQNNGHDAVTVVAAKASMLRVVHGDDEFGAREVRLENTP